MIRTIQTTDPAQAFPERYTAYADLRRAVGTDRLPIELATSSITTSATAYGPDTKFPQLGADLTPTEINTAYDLECEAVVRTSWLTLGRHVVPAAAPSAREGYAEYLTQIPLRDHLSGRFALMRAEVCVGVSGQDSDARVSYLNLSVSGTNKSWRNNGTRFGISAEMKDDGFLKPRQRTSPGSRVTQCLRYLDVLDFVEQNQARPNGVTYTRMADPTNR